MRILSRCSTKHIHFFLSGTTSCKKVKNSTPRQQQCLALPISSAVSSRFPVFFFVSGLIRSAIFFEHNTRVPLPSGKSINALYALLIAMGTRMLIATIISAALTCRCPQPNHLNHNQPTRPTTTSTRSTTRSTTSCSVTNHGSTQATTSPTRSMTKPTRPTTTVQNQPNYVSNKPNQSNWAQVHYQPNQATTTDNNK